MNTGASPAALRTSHTTWKGSSQRRPTMIYVLGTHAHPRAPMTVDTSRTYDRGCEVNPNWGPSLPDTHAMCRTCCGGGSAGSVCTQGASLSWRVANLALRRGCGLFACMLGEGSLVVTIFVPMCCTKLLKTSRAASVTPTPIVRTCDTPSTSCKSVSCVMDCRCVAILATPWCMAT